MPPPDHPWSVVVAHDGVFKIALLTLFDLPIERFWMWTMDLCGITVVELRAGRPVLRVHNLTAHLAAMTDLGGPGVAGSDQTADTASADRGCRRALARRRPLADAACGPGWRRSADPAQPGLCLRGRSLRRNARRSNATRSRRCAAFRAASRSSPRTPAHTADLDLGPGDHLELRSRAR